LTARHRLAALLAAAAAIVLTAGAGAQAPRVSPTIVLVSLDGFRWDYRSKAPTPALDALAARGVAAENMIPSFPSTTFPNHYTIVTGLYPGHHGIVGNNIYDAATGRSFAMSKRDEVRDPMWWGGEPIWTLAERARQKTDAFFWPGSEAPHDGIFSSYWQPYDAAMPADARVDHVLADLDRPAGERPTFITLYFEETDTAGHNAGPDAPQTRDAIVRDDSHVGRLTAGLRARGLLDQVNVVVVSDHGMAATAPDRVIALGDYLSDEDVITISDIDPTLGVFPKPGREDAVYRALSRVPHLSVYRKDETPARWHYREHPRVPPIVGVADEGWDIVRGTSAELARRQRTRPRRPGGQHGYDPQLLSMRATFIAAGPAFRQGVVVPPFENVSLYDVFGKILGVTVPPNDGDPAVAAELLR
jgi:predicted AlkP superfamily pyrophosphatase or phosphodiesterase